MATNATKGSVTGGWWLLGVLGLLLTGCGGSGPMWIHAPLIADTSRDTGAAGAGRPFDENLLVGEDAYAELKFSLDTLPNGVLSKLTIADGAATIGSETYTLTPEKVFRARLVLFVDTVEQPGYLAIDGAYTPGVDCFADESAPAVCTQTVAGTALAADADAPTQTLRITQRGYYSFDVTELVKDRLRNGYAGILRIRAARDPQANDWGRFLFASKEKVMGQAFVHHPQPQLLVTLTDAAAVTSSAFITSSVQNSQTDPSLAGRDFSQDAQMLANGMPSEIAYALAEPRGIPTAGATVRTFLNQFGTRSYKMTMTSSVDSAVPFSAQDPARIDWYRVGRLNNPNNNNRVITWNNGWSEPPASALIASNRLASDLPSQPVVTDLSAGYVAALRSSYAADDLSVSFAVAGKTNVQGPVTLEARYNAQTARSPRFETVIVPLPTNSFYTFDINDSTRAIKYCIGTSVTGAQCDAPTLALRARAGQPYAANTLIVDIRSLQGDTNVPYAAPIHIDVPKAGASVDLEADPNPDEQALAAGIADAPGYYISVRRANREVGTYKAVISMPGHNARAEIDFTNLPLPSPSLSGPARVTLPAGAGSVSVPVDAEVPFVLEVEDPVNANIDDTTKWLFASSVAADTMPGETQRSDGRVNLAMSFASPGPRTISVRSKGDATLMAAFDLVVDGGSTTTLVTPGPAAVFGQSVTLTAQVFDYAGAPLDSGTVEFRDGADLLGVGEIVAGTAEFATSTLAVGVHALSVNYAGDPDRSIAASNSAESAFVVDRAATAMTVSAPASSLIGAPVAVGITLGVVAPGAGTPNGSVSISDGKVSCSFEIGSAAGCTLTPTTAGERLLTATYSGDANFLTSSASASIAVLERAVLVASFADIHDYARYGRVADFTVTLRNTGLGTATQVAVAATLSAAFDDTFAHWQCFGAGAGATCAENGNGALHDLVTIPPGRSLTWRVSAPVRYDTPEPEAAFTFDVGAPSTQSIVHTATLVLLRDGFDRPYASGTAMTANDAEAILSGTRTFAFALPAATGRAIDEVLAVQGNGHAIGVQRTWQDASTPLIRLFVRDENSIERVSPWARTSADASLAISVLTTEDDRATLLLEGSATPISMTFPLRE